MKTSYEWLDILRSDPEFERLVKKSGAVRIYYRGFTKKPIFEQVRRAVETFRQSGPVCFEVDLLIQRKYHSNAKNFNTALMCWFAENWDSWMQEIAE